MTPPKRLVACHSSLMSYTHIASTTPLLTSAVCRDYRKATETALSEQDVIGCGLSYHRHEQPAPYWPAMYQTPSPNPDPHARRNQHDRALHAHSVFAKFIYVDGGHDPRTRGGQHNNGNAATPFCRKKEGCPTPRHNPPTKRKPPFHTSHPAQPHRALQVPPPWVPIWYRSQPAKSI